MSIGSFLTSLENDAKNFENVVIKDEQAAVAWAEGVFGKQNVDNAINSVEATVQTDLGKLTKSAVLFAEQTLGSGNGSKKASMVLNIVQMAAGALGIPFSASAINVILNLIAGFVGSKAKSVAAAVIQPAK